MVEECVLDCSKFSVMETRRLPFTASKIMLTFANSLAMAQMTTLLAALYRKYSTSVQERQNGASPGITSRFEVFQDDTLVNVKVSKLILIERIEPGLICVAGTRMLDQFPKAVTKTNDKHSGHFSVALYNHLVRV